MLGFLDWMSYQGFLDALRDAAANVFQWFWSLLSATFSPLWNFLGTGISSVAAKLPLLYSTLTTMAPYLNFINAWFPLDVLFDLIVTYSTFWLCLVVYRTVKSWIPTVSG